MPNQTEARKSVSATPYEELCGPRVGDRRVRVQRPPRGVGQKIISIVRRKLSH